jgi:hypothetical protein
MHEHIFVLSEGVAASFPSVWDAEAYKKLAIDTIRRLKERGVSTLVDMTVLGTGRNVPLVQQVARQSGLQVIVATGLYTYDALPHYFETRSIYDMVAVRRTSRMAFRARRRAAISLRHTTPASRPAWRRCSAPWPRPTGARARPSARTPRPGPIKGWPSRTSSRAKGSTSPVSSSGTAATQTTSLT